MWDGFYYCRPIGTSACPFRNGGLLCRIPIHRPGLPLTADMLTGDGQQRCEAQNRAEVRMGLDPSHVGVCKKLNDAYFIILLDGTTVSSELGYKPDLK
jgi:hypothetical protein